jgi:hypothetical protein
MGKRQTRIRVAAMTVAALFAAAATAQAQPGAESPFSFDDFDRLTRTYVNAEGLVDYAGLKKELPALRAVVERMAAHGPHNRPAEFSSSESRLRYYLMAYNANVLYITASAYPDRRALWNWLGLFVDHDIVLGGRQLSLNALEHQILRREFRDPRIHFYINCAARSCPPLPQGAIPPGGTEQALDEAARRFLSDPRHCRFDASTGTLYLSRIFDWFEEDFLAFQKERGAESPSLAGYALRYLNPKTRAAVERVSAGRLRVKFLDYDKSLNEQ